MTRSQDFWFSFSDYLLAEAGGAPLDALHWDVDAICRSYDALKVIADRLGVQPPGPHLPTFAYAHIAALGAEIVFPPGSEPTPRPLLKSPAEIDELREPEDYLQAELIQKRLALARELKRRRPGAWGGIGHSYEGPFTTAMLLLGADFLTLPYDDPARAHKLLDFCVRSALNYFAAMCRHGGGSLQPGPVGIPDDFAGMMPPALFGQFVAPYWERFYQGLQATRRTLHSELLRPGHLPFLAELKIEQFDPCGDQYVTPEILRDQCPVPFMLNIHAWEVRDMSIAELQGLYRRLASFEPTVIALEFNRLCDEPKIEALLDVARELKG
ncbi:MAG TPA: uroporphyrinogen decarboxylase family protein [Phycisphaerae bacterium]|nr:uroporphyrinogen decarboxylase family protein [Phycisphaerae bacterium]